MDLPHGGAPRPAPSVRLPGNPWTYALLSCFLLSALLAARLIHDFDLGYHLKGGQWILENHRLPSNDPFTYTVENHPYLDIQWLYQVGLYLSYLAGGYKFLSILNIMLITAAFALTFRNLRLNGAPYGVCVGLLALLVVSCENRFQVRPEIVSWSLLALTFGVLEARARGERDILWALPLLQVLWVNVEGLFPLGWVLMGAYCLNGLFPGGRLDKKLVRYSAVALACCLLNPDLLQGVLFPFRYLLTLGTSNVFKQNIAELQPTWTVGPNDFTLFVPWLPLAVYKVFSFLLLFLLAASFRRRKASDFLLALAFFYLSTTAQRNVPLFMILGLPIAAACWKDVPWEWFQKGTRSLFLRPLSAWTLAAVLLLFGARVVTGAYYGSDRRIDQFGLGLDKEKLPVKAAQFLVDNKLDGTILNQLNAGGWLVWKGPQKDFIDGRLEVMGADFFTEYMTAFTMGGLNRLSDRYRADIILFNPFAATLWIFDLKQSPDWRLVYLDGYYAVYLRKNYAPQVPALDYDRMLKDAGVDKTIVAEAGAIIPRPRPSPWRAWLEGFVSPQPYPHDLLNYGIVSFNTDHSEAAEPVFLEAIRRTGGRYFEFYLDAAMMYAFNRRYDAAKACLEQVLKEDPTNRQALRMMGRMGGV